ncbi:MAG: cbb3-type cytochrome c oxidase subunit I [Rhodoferax sp.]
MARAPTYPQRLAALPGADRSLFKAMAAAALLALLIGVLAGVATALVRGGVLSVPMADGYRFLTVHGVGIFFYWLFTTQTALLLALAACEQGHGLAWRPLAWAAFGLMLLGLVLSMAGSVSGTPLLYNGSPELVRENPRELLLFNTGYSLLGLGLLLLPLSAIVTLLRPRWQGQQDKLSAVGFALFAWAGFLVVTGFAALYTFVPGVLWALSAGPFPQSHGTRWHIVFHNMHYLPLMATVILWYVLMQALTGVKSVFGERFSKIVFSMYLVFVPPTSLYHMFLEPDLPKVVQVAGSMLSLFVSVPTLTAFLIIVASLEVHARSQGGRGLFGWIAMLPWRNPAMAAMGAAVLSMAFGLVFAFVLIQGQLAPLLSDTFFVPGYFHFFTVGTVSLTLLAALSVVLPAIGGRTLWKPELLRWMPWLALLGLLVFGAAGIAAGYLGVPRRVMDVGYQQQAPALWHSLMLAVAVGGSIMATALLVFAGGIATSLLPARRPGTSGAEMALSWGGTTVKVGTQAWVGPVSILVIVAAMYVFSALGFELMQSLPLSASGGGGH